VFQTHKFYCLKGRINTLARKHEHTKEIVVGGAGGFIGGHLVADLRRQGLGPIRAIDIKLSASGTRSSIRGKSRARSQRKGSVRKKPSTGVAGYNLAADMAAWASSRTPGALHADVLINTHMLMAARKHGIERFFYSSSACVYAAGKQRDPNVTALKEEELIPPRPRMVTAGKTFQRADVPPLHGGFRAAHARGPVFIMSTGRKDLRGRAGKSPAAICRKVIEAKLSGKPRSRFGATATRRAASCI